MRVVPFTPLIAAVVLFACSTFSDGSDDVTPPSDDGGPPSTPDASDSCTPVVFDPAAGSACPGVDLTQPQNCGACGHACIDSKCVEGRCEREQLSDARPIIAFIDNHAYAPIAGTSKIARADLSERPLTFTEYFDNQTGTVQHLEAHAGELYIGWDNDQTILKPGIGDALPTPRDNEGFDAVKTAEFGGHYLPGATSYYYFADSAVGWNLVRIGPDKTVDLKRENDLFPIARSGDAIYWTKKQGTSASSIVGPWERANETVAIVDGENKAFAAEGDSVFIVSGGYLSRATRGASAVARLAIEPGIGIAFAIDGDQLFYAVRRMVSGLERHQLYRIDKCAGGEPVPLIDINAEITAIHLHEKTHVTVSTPSGLFRTRR